MDMKSILVIKRNACAGLEPGAWPRSGSGCARFSASRRRGAARRVARDFAAAGRRVARRDSNGKPAVVVFCGDLVLGYCKAFMPYLKGIQQRLRASTASKSSRSTPKRTAEAIRAPTCRAWVSRRSPIANGDEIAAAYGIQYIPGLSSSTARASCAVSAAVGRICRLAARWPSSGTSRSAPRSLRSSIDKSSRSYRREPRYSQASHSHVTRTSRIGALDDDSRSPPFHRACTLLAIASYAGRASAQDAPRSSFGADATAEQVTAGIDLTGKTIVVTGCNSGIGLETMRVLALRGAHVIGTARTLERGQEACASIAGQSDAGRARAQRLRLRRRVRRGDSRARRRRSTRSSATPACC